MKILRILEISWLIIAIGSLCAGVYKLISAGLNQAVFIFAISMIAFVFVMIRRKQRIAMEKQNTSR